MSLPLILDVSDDSSSDDNLLDVNEWQLQTQSVFENHNRSYSLPQTALTVHTNDANVCFPPRNEEQSTNFSVPHITELDEAFPHLPNSKKKMHSLPPLEETDDPLIHYINQLYVDEKQRVITCCDSIEECRSLNRIISCLNFYERIMTNLDIKNRSDVIREYFSHYRTTFLDDYYHVLSQHLNGNQVDNDINFELIYNKCCKYAACNIQHHSTKHRNSSDEHVRFYMDLLHDIHVLFIHSYDTGFRVKQCPMEMEQTEGGLFYNDDALQYFHSALAKKREQWLSAKGEQFREMNKFNHTFAKQSSYNIYTDTNEAYNLGMDTKCFYWDYYKRNGSESHIEQKYDSLKHEMLDHTQCKLTLQQFNDSYHKATCFMNTIYAKNGMGTADKKRVYIFDEHNECEKLHYDIDEDDAISVEHMLSIIFYTDYMELSHCLRKSFMLDATQNIAQYKENRREFWHWTKLMIECVEIYGEWIEDGAFYAGIDYPLVFETFNEKWNGAMSVTKELSVCWMYCDPNGYILELASTSSKVKLFNASFLSSFGYESEFISVGGCVSGKSFKIESIRSVTCKQNYAAFIRAIHMVYIALNGQYLNCRATQTDSMIIEKLMAHKLGMRYNKLPTYVNRLFSCMINNRKYIKLNVEHLSNMKLSRYFMENIVFNSHNHCDVVSLEKLSQLCAFCHTIDVEMDKKRNVMSEYVWSVLISKMYAIDSSNVERITMQNVANYDKYSSNSLNRLGWDIQVDRGHHYGYQYVFSKKHNVVMKFKTLLISR